jgi:hypothetical protein
MVDLKNKPEGATHYANFRGSSLYIKNLTGAGYEYWIESEEDGKWRRGGDLGVINQAVSIEPWSIHNNTLPLSELSDEQAGELFNYGDIEFKNHLGGWECEDPEWIPSLVYRAKQAVDRELFIESFEGVNLTGTRSEIIETLYVKGFKAPKIT